MEHENKYSNQEAFVLSAKRIKARILKAKELKVDTLTPASFAALVESLSLAKAIEQEKPIDTFRKGQEYYIQTLVDALAKPIEVLMDAEYAQATLELGTEDETLKSLADLRVA